MSTTILDKKVCFYPRCLAWHSKPLVAREGHDNNSFSLYWPCSNITALTFSRAACAIDAPVSHELVLMHVLGMAAVLQKTTRIKETKEFAFQSI